MNDMNDGLDLHGFGFGGHTISNEHEVYLYDGNTRRTILVAMPNPDGIEPPDHDPEFNLAASAAAAALRRHLEDLPLECDAIEVDLAGNLVSTSTQEKSEYGPFLETEYLLLDQYQLPPDVAARTVLRSELTEIGRIVAGIDLVAYSASRPKRAKKDDKNGVVFKYSRSSNARMWREMQMLARLPPHPHMALLDRFVLDEVTGSRVVGFTMRYVAGGTLAESKNLVKLKWLKQLMRTVDDLNLKHGITHQDIADRNIMLDPATDSVVLIDFDVAFRAGMTSGNIKHEEGKWEERDDVKGILVFLYKHITRDPALDQYYLHELDEKDFDLDNPAKWVKHADVSLDGHDVADFHREVMAWVRKRRGAGSKQMAHYTEAPEPLDWPAYPARKPRRGDSDDIWPPKAGLPGLVWTRPLKSKVDPARRLLATGRYADEEAAAPKATAAGFIDGGGRWLRPRKKPAPKQKAQDDGTNAGGGRRKPRPRRKPTPKRKARNDGDAGGPAAAAPTKAAKTKAPAKKEAAGLRVAFGSGCIPR